MPQRAPTHCGAAQYGRYCLTNTNPPILSLAPFLHTHARAATVSEDATSTGPRMARTRTRTIAIAVAMTPTSHLPAPCLRTSPRAPLSNDPWPLSHRAVSRPRCAIRVSCFFSVVMEVKRRADWSGAWRMVAMRGLWTPMRRQSDWTVKIVVACCVALFFLSPGFSRMLPNDSTTYLGRSAVLERRSMMAHEVARRSEMRERILHAVVDTGARREGAEDDLTNDYSTPTHNYSGHDESPSPPVSKNTARSRGSQQFSRYTAQFGHRHLRGV